MGGASRRRRPENRCRPDPALPAGARCAAAGCCPVAAAMIGFMSRLFARSKPVLQEAGPRDAAAFAVLHASSFQRGWSEDELERLLMDRQVIAHRAVSGKELTGFILSRMAAGEAEIL